MRYISTRGRSEPLDFEESVLAGLAPDGGLYIPESWPRLDPGDLARMAGLSYEETAFHILHPFLGGMLAEAELRQLISAAYGGFDHPDRTPLLPLGNRRWLLELHHGPTLAFKDLAMQFLARIMDEALARRGGRATVICATSGDTGSAALEAYGGRARMTAFALFPAGRISEAQRRQMTTLETPNTHAIEVDGTFDDIQALVKRMFDDRAFRDRLALAAVNSINWARILAQVVYYFYAGLRAGAPEQPVAFTVPSGNFGNAFAGYVAARMGLPVARILIATNANDILHRTLSTGRGTLATVTPTSSPSMDIQVASNFERALFEASGRDADRMQDAMATFSRTGTLELAAGERTALDRIFASAAVSESETSEAIARTARDHGRLVDPHTAVGLQAADITAIDAPMIVLATAHPAKFPEAVEAAAGRRPEVPERLAAVMHRPERKETAAADLAALQTLIEEKAEP